MAMKSEAGAPAHRGSSTTALVAVLLVLGALVTYKASGSMTALAKAQRLGTLAPKVPWIADGNLPVWTRPFAGTASYLAWVVIALGFGLVLGALVRAVVPERLVRALASRGPSGLFVAALIGAPLMLCSCCVAPLFDGVYSRTKRLGPALALMFAAPGLNPAALLLTFVLFPRHLAIGRVVLALTITLGASAALGRVLGAEGDAVCTAEPARELGFRRAFAVSLYESTLRTMPAILLGVVLSVTLMQVAPFAALGSGGRGIALVLVALVAVLAALPTFGEIPIALALLAAGASESVALSVLVAGPIINLPSLLTLRKTVSARAAIAAGASVYLIALAGSALVGSL